MKIIDLTHTFNEAISVYPGGDRPTVNQITNVPKHGYASKQLAFTSHQGTHIDGMAHMEEHGKTLADIPLHQFKGKALTVDVREFAGRTISIDPFKVLEKELQQADFVLLYSGWSSHWGKKSYEEDFPTPSEEAMRFLAQQNLKGVGMDCFSPDPVDSPDYLNHHIAFEKNILLIENLTQLDQLPLRELVEFQCFPMKIDRADGAPVRALAMI
ncbi:MAG: cyclase family protein [Saprospiraceae bacterium]